MRNGYAVVDLEMTGYDYREDAIIEIAVGVSLPGQSFVTDRVLIKIDRPLPSKISS